MKLTKLIILLFLFSLINVFGVVRYVSKTGSSTPPYITWETASDSIQKCINLSEPGDTIYIGTGVYTEKIVMKDKTSLIGIDRDSSIIDNRPIADRTMIIIYMGDSCLVENMHIISSNVNQKYGQGIVIHQKNFGIIRNNKIENAAYGINSSFTKYSEIYNNTISFCGKSIDFDAPRPEGFNSFISSNLLINNQSGIQIFYDGNATIENNIILFNDQNGSGIYVGLVNGLFKVVNNLVTSQNNGYVGIVHGSNDILFNNVVVGVGTSIWIRRRIPFYNNIVTDGIKGVRYDIDDTPIKYNAFYNNQLNIDHGILDSTNIVADPMFVNRTKDSLFDGHLQKYSPLIDAGDPAILDVDGSRSDIGMYGGPYGESYTYIDYAPHVPHNLTSTIVKKNITIDWKMNTEIDFSHYEVYLDTTETFTPDSIKLIAIVDTNNYQGTLSNFDKSTYYRILSVDNQGNKSVLSEPVSVIITGVEEEPLVQEMDYMLYNAYPNPFNPSTTIAYRLKEDGYVKLSVYDIKGELVELLVNDVLPKGYYEASFSPKNTGKDLASGIYIYRIDIRNSNNIPVYSDMKKMILMK